MEAFFRKYPVDLSESIAIDMIHKKLELAKELYEQDEENEMYCKELATAMAMLEDYFNEKGIDPTTLL